MLPKIVAALLIAYLTAAAPVSALEIDAFDQLSAADQGRYLELLVNGSKTILARQGQQDMAQQLNAVFDAPAGGISKAMRQLDDDLEAARQYQQKTGKTMHVEHALLLTFSKFQVTVPQVEVMKLGQDFEPTPAR